MQLTEQQIIELKKLVADMVDYQETYLELYDHILTALEQKDDHTGLLDAVDAIIDEDFGGYECLFKTEDERQKIVSRQITKQHWRNFVMYIKPPMAILTVAAGWLFYIILNRFLNFMEGIDGLMFVDYGLMFIAMTPLFIRRKYEGPNYDQRLEGRKKSIKDRRISQLTALGCRSLVLTYLPVFFLGHHVSDILKLHSALIAVIFTAYVVYVLSFFKLYRQEFKIRLT